MAGVHTNVSGVWKQVTALHTNVSGTWKSILQGWTNVSGTWKLFYAAITMEDDTYSDTGIGGVATASVSFDSDGTVDSNESANEYTWLGGGSAGDYEIRATLNSGTTPQVGNLDTWEALSSDRGWSLIRAFAGSGSGTSTSNLTLEIRVGSTVVASCTVVLSATT